MQWVVIPGDNFSLRYVRSAWLMCVISGKSIAAAVAASTATIYLIPKKLWERESRNQTLKLKCCCRCCCQAGLQHLSWHAAVNFLKIFRRASALSTPCTWRLGHVRTVRACIVRWPTPGLTNPEMAKKCLLQQAGKHSAAPFVWVWWHSSDALAKIGAPPEAAFSAIRSCTTCWMSSST